MAEPSRLRDSTQIVLPKRAIDGLTTQLADEFAVTVYEEDDGYCRIIGSPIVIKQVSDFLSRRGVQVP